VRAIFDEREPKDHPWLPFLPEGWTFERARLETGDLALAAMPEGAVVERKTPSDLIACMTSARERFERELSRSRYLGRFVVVVEGGLPDVLAGRRQMSEASVIGSLSCSKWGIPAASSERATLEPSWACVRSEIKAERLTRNYGFRNAETDTCDAFW
jgi:ERCC4-type nuclease